MPDLSTRPSGTAFAIAAAGIAVAFALAFLIARGSSSPPAQRAAAGEPALPAMARQGRLETVSRRTAAPLPDLRPREATPVPVVVVAPTPEPTAAPTAAPTPAPTVAPVPPPPAAAAPPPPVAAPVSVSEPDQPFDSSEEFDSSG